MAAFVIAGVILGAMTRVLRHGRDDPPLASMLLVGVVGALIGGVGMNLVLAEPWTALGAWSFTGCCILALVLLGLYQGGVGRKR